MITDYQTLSLKAPQDYILEGDEVLCIVTLDGLKVGTDEVYGQITAKMTYDEAADCFEPGDAVSIELLDNQHEKPYTGTKEQITQAMWDAYERFQNYFDYKNTREI